MENLESIIGKMKEALKTKLGKISVFNIPVKHWIDIEPHYEKVTGVKVEDEEFISLIGEALEAIIDKTGRSSIEILNVIATEEDVLVSYRYEVRNQYGRYVGCEYNIIYLSVILDDLEELQVNKEKIRESLQKLLQQL